MLFYLLWVFVILGLWCMIFIVFFVSEFSIVGFGFRKWVLMMVFVKGLSLNLFIFIRGLGYFW